MKPIRVAVVDDSSFIRRAINRLLEKDLRVRVVGTAASGEELLSHLGDWRPEVITLDLAMPGMGGLATLDRIMALRPTPVIILSTHSGQGAPQTIEALHRGAVDFIDKQRYSLVDFQALRTVLVEKILEVCGAADPSRPSAKVAGPTGGKAPEARRRAAKPEKREPDDGARKAFELLVVGASTGGPPAIQRVIEDLGSQAPVPILIAQHMPEGFTRAFAARLHSYLPCAVHEARDGEPLLPGTVYLGPAGSHLRVFETSSGLQARVSNRPTRTQHRPSVDLLFSSAAQTLGRRALALLLTGMGRDGAVGMARLHRLGAHTLAQDEESSIVYGMPKAAVDLGVVKEILPLKKIGRRLRELLSKRVETSP